MENVIEKYNCYRGYIYQKKQTFFPQELLKSPIITSCKVYSKREMPEAIVHTASEGRTEDYLITWDTSVELYFVYHLTRLSNKMTFYLWFGPSEKHML